MLMISVSIDCDIEQCAKPSKLYEELGCKAVFGSRSCCAKRYECPDFKNLDDNKCTYEGKEYRIGEILPRTLASNTKCVETCFCTRSVCISFSFLSFSARYFLISIPYQSLTFVDKTTSPLSLRAKTVTVAFRVWMRRAAWTSTETWTNAVRRRLSAVNQMTFLSWLGKILLTLNRRSWEGDFGIMLCWSRVSWGREVHSRIKRLLWVPLPSRFR